MALDVRLCIILLISCDISFQVRFYYKLNGEQKMPKTDWIDNINVNRVVIDLERWLVVDSIEVTTLGESAKPNVFVRYFDGFKEIKLECKPGKENFICDTMGMFAVVESEAILQKVVPSLIFNALEEFVGCFENLNTSLSGRNYIVSECQDECKVFYGLNTKGDCICVHSLNELVQVELSLCNELYDKFDIVGKNDHFAVYWKGSNKSLGYARPSWDCIYELKDCPKCPKGRMGIFCDIVDCSVDNGNCGDSECQNILLWNFFKLTNCFCKTGFRIGPTQCEDIDECANSSNSCITSSTKCVNSQGSYTCECSPGFKRLNEFECEALQEHEKEQEKEQDKEQEKEQDKETDQEKDPKVEMTLVYTGTGFAAVALFFIVIVYIYFKKKSSPKTQT